MVNNKSWYTKECNATKKDDYIGAMAVFWVLSSFMTYHRFCNWSDTTGVTSGAGTCVHSWCLEG